MALVSQSTMLTHEFREISERLVSRFADVVVLDKFGATKERQSDLVSLVDEGAEAIVVIGGKHSANTRKLAKLAGEQKRPPSH